MARRGQGDPVEIVWEAPPTRAGQPNPYREVVREVKAAPGRWARVRVFPTQSPAYNARKSIRTVAPEPEWEITVSKIVAENGGPDTWGVWLRFRTDAQMRAAK